MANNVDIRITAHDGSSATFRKIGASANAASQDIQHLGTAGSASISDLSGELETLGGAMVGVGAVATTAVAAPMLLGAKAAWQEADATQQATVAMKAYVDNGEQVQDVLGGLLDYATDIEASGGLFFTKDLYDAAQNLIIYGDNVEDVVGHVETLSKVVGLGTATWDELNEVIGRVGATGKLTSDDFDQLRQMGFLLDESLRKTDVTWDELFRALSKGLPDDVLAGQAGTIRSAMLNLQGGILDLGAAFLDLDRTTGEFAEGGLGDTLFGALTESRGLLASMEPVASAAGGALATAIGDVTTVVTALSGPAQTAATALAAVGGASSLLSGAMLLLVPRVTNVVNAFVRLGGIRGVFTAMLGAINPVSLAIGGLAVAGGVLLQSWIDQRQAAAAYDGTLETLSATLEQIRRQGDAELAEAGGEVENRIDAIREKLSGIRVEMIDPLTGLSIDLDPHLLDDLPVVGDTISDAFGDLDKSTEALEAFNAALKDPAHVDVDAYTAWVNGMLEAAAATETTTDDIEALDRIIASQEHMPERFLREYTDNVKDAGGATTATSATMDALGLNLGDINDQAVEAGKAWQEYNERFQELMETGRELAGFDQAVFGAHTSAAQLAQSLTQAGNAAENTFRIIVGNTNAIKSQADSTLQWADSLIAVRGEWSRLDELVQQGLITGTSGVFDDGSQYAAAQNAYDSIAVTTQQIKDNLDAVQAIQAPLVAQAQEDVARWTEELRGMSAEQQRITLGWYDAATAQQALEAQSLITAAAAGEMGASGEQATQRFIKGAIAANPVLEDLLTDLELVSRDREGNLKITFDDGGAQSDIDLLNDTITTLNEILVQAFNLDIEVTGTDDVANAVTVLQDVLDQDGQTATVGVDTAGQTLLDNLLGTVDDVLAHDGETATVSVDVQSDWITDARAANAHSAAAQLGLPDDIAVDVTFTGDDSDARDTAAYWTGMQGVTIASLDVAFLGDQGGQDGALSTTAYYEAIAGREVASLNVGFTGDDSDAQAVAAYWAGHNGTTIASVDVAFLGDDGGRDGALTTKFNWNAIDQTVASVNVAFEGDDSDAQAVAAYWAGHNGVTIATAQVDVTGDNSDAISTINDASAALAGIDGDTAILTAAGVDDASVVLAGADAMLWAIDGDTASLYATGVDNASATLAGADAMLWAIDGDTAYLYVNTIHTDIYRTTGYRAYAQGGVVGQDGGMFADVARAANGRTVMVGEHGPELVDLPAGSYVTPHAASESRVAVEGGPGGITINFNGDITGADRDTMNRWAEEDFIPELERALARQRRGQGSR